MGKTITIDDDAYRLLRSLKQGESDSFTKVILRNIYRPAETAGELLERMADFAPPRVNLQVLTKLRKERGRRSSGRGRK